MTKVNKQSKKQPSRIVEIMKKLDYKLFLVILFAQMLPLIYKGTRIFWVADIGVEGLELNGMSNYLILFFEAITSLFVLPIYGYLRKGNPDENTMRQRAIIALGLSFTGTLMLVGLMAAVGYPLAKSIMGVSDPTGGLTTSFVYKHIILQSIGFGVMMLTGVIISYIILTQKKASAIIFSTMNVLGLFFFDALFLSG